MQVKTSLAFGDLKLKLHYGTFKILGNLVQNSTIEEFMASNSLMLA